MQPTASEAQADRGTILYRVFDVLERAGVQWSAPHIEFGCILVNRVIKQNFRPEHEQRLCELAAQSPANCEHEARRFFQPADVRLILQAARSGEWSRILRYRKDLLRGLMRSAGA